MGSGGAILRIMMRYGTSCVTMVVALIPATAAAAMGSTSAVSRPPSMASTFAKVSSS